MPISERIIEAAKDVVSSKVSNFKARNGKMVGIQDDAGEKMWIVPFDEMFELESALSASPSDAERHERVVPDGWQLVPKKPTPEMDKAGQQEAEECERAFGSATSSAMDIFAAMIAASPPPPAAAQEPVAVKAEDIEVIEEVVGGYDWLGTGSSYDHAGKREAEQAWSRIRSALSTSKSAPAPEIARDCGIDGGSLTEHQDCIGKAYTESLARGLMFEARISLIARTIRNSLRKYGHKTAESVLPECIAADVERTLVAATAAEATERAPEIAALRAENERLREALWPFAKVAEKDIGETEEESDLFVSPHAHNRAPRLVVGDFLRARAAVTPEQEEEGE